MNNMYEGKNIKVGSLRTFLPMAGIDGELIYIAQSDGKFYGIGGMDNAVWIQSLPQLPDENADLFIKGVELIDKHAPAGKMKKAFAVLKSLAKRENKAGIWYCKMLNFFFDLGRWDGIGKPLDYIKNIMWKYRVY